MIKTDEQRMLENILNGLNPDQKIYRVFSIDRFFELIENRHLVLVKPELWDDPFENFLSKTTAVNSNGEQIGFNITNDFFGQCWTLRKECDGIWRNYASLSNGVRVETTVEKLLKTISKHDPTWKFISCFIGKVEYLSEEEIINFLNNENFMSWVTDTSGKNTARMLLIKRDEFHYEEEVRLLYADRENKDSKKIWTADINPHELFESFCFAPQVSTHLYEIYKDNLVSRGFDKNIIQKSKLYEPYKIIIDTNKL